MKNNMIIGIIAITAILGVAVYSKYNSIDQKKVEELLILEDKYPAAAQDIANGKRYNTTLETQQGGSRKRNRRRNHKKVVTKKHITKGKR
jgi:hypothetical protein